jgi:hypothetical protein
MKTHYEKVFDTVGDDNILWNCLIAFKNEVVEKYIRARITGSDYDKWRWFKNHTTVHDLKEDCITDATWTITIKPVSIKDGLLRVDIKGTYAGNSLRMGDFIQYTTNPDYLIDKLRRTIWENLCN